MLLNVSYSDKTVTRKIDLEVGKPFTIKERWAMDGIGSPKLYITETSMEIHNLLILDNHTNTCNVEMRPRGIIVRFRSLLETFALVIPYYKLIVQKSDLGIYTLYRDHYFIRMKADTKAIQKFFKKILDYKLKNGTTSIEDL